MLFGLLWLMAVVACAAMGAPTARKQIAFQALTAAAWQLALLRRAPGGTAPLPGPSAIGEAATPVSGALWRRRNLGPCGPSSTVSWAAPPSRPSKLTVVDPVRTLMITVSAAIPTRINTRAESRNGCRLDATITRPSTVAENNPRPIDATSMMIGGASRA
jgi:hypothetical protein